jgi:hypothetical protein
MLAALDPEQAFDAIAIRVGEPRVRRSPPPEPSVPGMADDPVSPAQVLAVPI